MSTNVKTHSDARDAILRGFNVVADAVKGTLGAAGYNGLLETQLYPFTQTTNDGVSIAKAIHLTDPYENLGARLAQEICERSDKQSRDGTTTAITIAQAILNEGVNATVAPMQLKRELEACIPLIEAAIDAQKKDITVDEVGKVAAISAEDEEIGAMIQDIYKQIGKDGIIFRDISKTFNDYYDIGKGIQMEDTGFASPYMADTDEKTQQFLNVAKLKNPKILLTKQKLLSGAELNQMAAQLHQQGVSGLVIFADDYEPTVVTNLVMTRIQRGFRFVLVKMPVLWKDQWFEDLALMTGATIIDPAAGITFKDMKETYLGSVEHIEIFKDQLFIDGIADISAHLESLREKGDDDSLIRAARLARKTARLYVGAPTEQALSYRRLKVEDACGAAWQALHGGIVAGGGVALKNIAGDLPATTGGHIVGAALYAPIQQIIENAGGLDIHLEGAQGYDAKTNQVVDMFDAGIVDAANTMKNSARNAISVAAQILTMGVAVTLPRNPQGHLLDAGNPVTL